METFNNHVIACFFFGCEPFIVAFLLFFYYSLGRLSFSYAIGFIFGPMLGGTASKYISYSTIAFIAGIGSTIVSIILYIYLPVIPVPQKEQKQG